MLVKLNYKPSEALYKSHLIATGEQLKDKFLSVELTTLTPEQRAVIVRSGIDNYKGEVSYPLLVTGVDAKHYSGPQFTTESLPELDAIPTVEEWIAIASKALASRDKFQPELDTILTERRQAKEAHDKRLAEVQARYKALQAEWLPRIEKMTEAEANQPLPDDVLNVENELRALLGSSGKIWSEISAAKSNRWRELHDDRIKAKALAIKTAWIAEHGSDRLKRAIEKGHDCQRKYVIERSAVEAPGYVVDFENAADWKDRPCPSLSALNEADEAESLKLGNVKIVWLTDEPRTSKRTSDDYYEDEFQACEAVVIRGYLGKYDLVKAL
jgi:hypothetical protein